MSLLEKINNPKDLKKLNISQLVELSNEIRAKIINVIKKNGGHLASSLGAVDVIIALYYVFDFPKDKIVFDVGHQSYAHKILSDRKDLFETIRTEGGLSGFPNIFESVYDSFTVGHAGTSISAALGIANARDVLKDDYFVISLVGDGSIFNGENLEAFISSEKKPEKFLVILNDNGMSIARNVGGMSKYLGKIRSGKTYVKAKKNIKSGLGRIPLIGSPIVRGIQKVKTAFRTLTIPGEWFEELGIKYIGQVF